MSTAEKIPINKRAAVYAGLVAGALFIVLQTTMAAVFVGQSPWVHPRLIAGMVMGEAALAPLTAFSLPVIAAGLAVHFALAVLFSFALAWVIGLRGLRLAVLDGAIFGFVLYYVNYYGFTAIFPWFALSRNWPNILNHVVFGAIAAFTYKRLLPRKGK